QPRQGRLGGGGGEDQQVLAAQVLHQGEDAHPGDDLQQGAEHQDDEQDAGGVERTHQQRHGPDGGPAGGADDGGDSTEGTDGGDPHDHHQDPEHHALDEGEYVQQRLAGLAHFLQGEPDEQGHEQDRQHRD